MTLIALVTGVLAGVVVGPFGSSDAALVQSQSHFQILIGRDDDNVNNPIIQPPGVAADQSLANTDVIVAKGAQNVLIGLLGSDVLQGGPGGDILVGGTEQGTRPNSDVMFGNSGNDVSLWAPGDGSDAFLGGAGTDAQVFGVIDRVNNVPTVTGSSPQFLQGVPTANVTGMNGFCTIERVTDPSLGYQFLARFFVRTTGALAVTIRLSEVEQAFCASQAGGQITYADLSQANPQFVVVSEAEVAALNRVVADIIR
jgi:hypothetical protein